MGEVSNLNQNCRTFHEMDKSTHFFSLFGWWGGGWGCQNVHLNHTPYNHPKVWQENVLSPKSKIEFWDGGGGGGGSEHHFNHSWDILHLRGWVSMSSHFMWRHNEGYYVQNKLDFLHRHTLHAVQVFTPVKSNSLSTTYFTWRQHLSLTRFASFYFSCLAHSVPVHRNWYLFERGKINRWTLLPLCLLVI